MIVIDASVWKPIRKLLNPSFNMKILQSFVSIFNEKTNVMLEKLDKEVDQNAFDISPYMFACTLDMVCGKYFNTSQLGNYISFQSVLIEFSTKQHNGI